MDAGREFFDKNTKEVNSIVAKTLIGCSFILLLLMCANWVGFFHFAGGLKLIIIGAGLFVTLSPTILIKLNVDKNFIKYYILISLSVLIGILGTNNGIGIYITYILIPLMSCLYFDKYLTQKMVIISYLTMTIGVYFNSAGKLEVQYKNWTHMLTFRNYMIGFTLEYIAFCLFLYQVVKRSQGFIENQLSSLYALKEENQRQERVSSIYSNIIPNQKKTAMNMVLQESDSLTADCYTRLAAGHQFTSGLQDMLMFSGNVSDDLQKAFAQVGEYFSLDRILYIEGNREGNMTLSFQWNREGIGDINDFYQKLTPDDYLNISTKYIEDGYIEMYKSDGIFNGTLKGMESDYTRYVEERVMLGAQFWVPVYNAEEIRATVCFDRLDQTHYSVVDKYLLSEAATILGAQISRMNSDKANQAKSIFLSNMSHEIRTPMNAILGMVNVSLRDEMSDGLRQNLNVIQSSAEGLLGIINDILDFSKIESGKFDIIEDNYRSLSLINDVLTIAETRNSEKRLKLTIDISENFPSILYGDIIRVKQIMVNLVTNAVKYTDKGSVDLKVSMEHRASGDWLLFSVKDTGKGIREQDKGLLFRSFSQADQKQNHHVEGTGLGLAISKQLVELMGGSIGYESEYGKGSCFYFEIPQKVVDSTPAGKLKDYKYEGKEGVSNEVDMSFRAPNAKVMIVDDNEMNLMVAEALFEPFEMQITTVTSGKEALEKIKANTYDLIFMDHFMPEMDGVETTHAIRNMEGNPNQQTPIVALTADALKEVREKLLSEGMDEFLSKPIDMKQAVNILKKYLK